MPFAPPRDLPDPGIEPTSLASPAWQVDSLPLSHQGMTFLMSLIRKAIVLKKSLVIQIHASLSFVKLDK